MKESAVNFLVTIFNLNSSQRAGTDRLEQAGIEKIFFPVTKENENHWSSSMG